VGGTPFRIHSERREVVSVDLSVEVRDTAPNSFSAVECRPNHLVVTWSCKGSRLGTVELSVPTGLPGGPRCQIMVLPDREVRHTRNW